MVRLTLSPCTSCPVRIELRFWKNESSELPDSTVFSALSMPVLPWPIVKYPVTAEYSAPLAYLRWYLYWSSTAVDSAIGVPFTRMAPRLFE